MRPEIFDDVRGGVNAPINGVMAGAFVKVHAPGESFWVLVTSINGAQINGVVDNNLMATDRHGLKVGDPVTLEYRHVIDVMDGTGLN